MVNDSLFVNGVCKCIDSLVDMSLHMRVCGCVCVCVCVESIIDSRASVEKASRSSLKAHFLTWALGGFEWGMRSEVVITMVGIYSVSVPTGY